MSCVFYSCGKRRLRYLRVKIALQSFNNKSAVSCRVSKINLKYSIVNLWFELIIMSKKREYSCTVRTCDKKYANGLFSVPKDKRFQKWNDLLKLDPNIKKHQICKEHFALDDLCDGDERLKLRKNALPSINLPIWVSSNFETKSDQFQYEAFWLS